MDRNRYVALAVVFLILLAVLRILLTYKVTSQAFDEPCHVAAAIECDRDWHESFRSEFFVEGLPDWQVKAASSPGRP